MVLVIHHGRLPVGAHHGQEEREPGGREVQGRVVLHARMEGQSGGEQQGQGEPVRISRIDG